MSEKTEEGKQMENTSSIVTITTTTPEEGNNGNDTTTTMTTAQIGENVRAKFELKTPPNELKLSESENSYLKTQSMQSTGSLGGNRRASIGVSPRNVSKDKLEMKERTIAKRGSLKVLNAKSPNYMVATDPVHYMPEKNTNFAKALQLTIDVGLEKKKKTNRRRMVGMKYKGRLRTAAEEVRSQKKKEKKRAKRNQLGKDIRGKDVIGREHEMYALTYGMMIGVQYSVGRQFQADVVLDHNNVNNNHNNKTTNANDKDKDSKEGQQRSNKLTRAESSAMMDINAISTRLNLIDFMNVEKYVFPLTSNMINGAKGAASSDRKQQYLHFKFKDYAGLCFRHLRNLWGVDPAEYLLSICGNIGFIKFISNSKSGQYFFYSNDYKYMIKTLTDTECKFLRRILPYLVKHMIQYPDSLINRYYGLHRVKMPHIRRRLHFVVMNNIFHTPKEIHTKYDLKGATYKGRYTKHEKISSKPSDSVRKDLNLLGYNDSLEEALPELAQRFMLGDPERRKKFLDQVKADAYFLAKMGIMDYSLLVGVHGRTPKLVPGYNIGRGDGKANGFVEVVEDAVERDRELKDAQRFVYNTKKSPSVTDAKISPSPSATHTDDETYESDYAEDGEDSSLDQLSSHEKSLPIFNREHGGYCGKKPNGENNNEIYYFGIIDILQQYNLKKAGENFFKSHFTKQGGKQISSQPPQAYAERFVKFIEENTD